MPFEISTEVSFSAAHYIAGYCGDCARMHGHNWRVRAALRAAGLDGRGEGPVGVTYDFRKLKALMSEVAGLLDHSVLNEHPCFQARNPTAEAIAEWFFGELERRLTEPSVRVTRVEVWESAHNCAAYSKE
jgi:6-pyruvoyltetrahydropterin/6-carboxytetrahydropterin synthase